MSTVGPHRPAGPVRRRLVVLALTAALAVTGVVAGVAALGTEDHREGDPASVLSPVDPPEVVAEQLSSLPPGKQLPLRRGERRMLLEMPTDYTPSSPGGAGTDDYRCFLLDPGLEDDVWLTGSHVLPGNPEVVHHVILFRVEPDQVETARALDHKTVAPGWSCFGGSGVEGSATNLADASWLAAWAPGGDETRTRDGHGVRLEAGSQVVMQVHYNLLRGQSADRSATQLRWMPGERDLTPLHTYLMPAPVELPCRAARSDGPLCERDAAMADLRRRFGGAASTVDMLHLLCGESGGPSETTTCTRRVSQPMTVLGVAGHMHLLGREISVVANAGTPEERTLLDIDTWDFDDQGSRQVEALRLEAGETLTVTCRHQQWLRDKLPAFAGQEEKYVLWGEGSTDEMCLGTLQVAYDSEPVGRF
ncbi:hypothetical protein BKA08_003727 [Nocardioides marinisabuli]|uniref:Copper type II ascorbate-dependent monooxygenase C-terminal domain-containing protein n=1 Tax=Nocardioides marinisabuli TaxID=419476 RepID=A0A7Y9F4H4_9ACTN|nr:hypothetical protein [Nocardioides marinisabuli]NYD59489.1 hypothetical protein [Nocardioides marinisabuli]